MRFSASRWRRSLEPQSRTLDGNRTGQTEPDQDKNQDPDGDQGPEEEGGALSSEQPDNSSQIEVLLGRGKARVGVWMIANAKIG